MKTIYVQFAEDGIHIRKWSHEPFEGGDAYSTMSSSTDTKLVETVSPGAQQAWVDYDPVGQFAENMSFGRFNGMMRHAFLSGYQAALTAIQSQTGDASQLCERLRAPEFAEKVALAIETNIGAQADDQEAFFAPRADDDPTITLDCEFDPVEVARVVLEVVSTTLLEGAEGVGRGGMLNCSRHYCARCGHHNGWNVISSHYPDCPLLEGKLRLEQYYRGARERRRAPSADAK